MNEDMIQTLSKLGFKWEPNTKATKARCKSFDQWLVEYKAFKMKFGESEEPRCTGEYKALGTWCASMRRTYKDFIAGEKKRSSRVITQEQVDCLEKHGFKWSCTSRGTREKRFEQRVEELKELQKIHGLN